MQQPSWTTFTEDDDTQLVAKTTARSSDRGIVNMCSGQSLCTPTSIQSTGEGVPSAGRWRMVSLTPLGTQKTPASTSILLSAHPWLLLR